jgi:hypothetical protein
MLSEICCKKMGVISPEIRGRGMKPTIHVHLVPRLRMVELYLYFLDTAS